MNARETRGFRIAVLAGLATTAVAWPIRAVDEPPKPVVPPRNPSLEFIYTGMENGSPLQWAAAEDGTVHVRVLQDYERDSTNRAAGHWYFRLQGKPGAELTLVLEGFDNVYNGKLGSPVSNKSICYVSSDGARWNVVPAELIEGNRLRLRVRLENGSLDLARLEPYRLSDLQRLLDTLRDSRLTEIVEIGRTVEGRPLEMVRVGDPAASHRVLLRARAHPWESGGNWVVEGLLRALVADDPVSQRCLARYCVHVMPMANKDGVARGMTRFNMLGKDLNRDWDRPADPRLAPENHALETWLGRMRAEGKAPELVIDLHNDESGRLHVSRPEVENLSGYLDRMRRLEQLLRKHTWFTEGSTMYHNPGTLGEGLVQRYAIDACILELNCNWVAGLEQPPSAEAWKTFGRQLREVFFEYFAP